MIGSLLVANRGEIAVRILRTCRRLGVRGVAVYSDADAGAWHVRMADAAVRIGPPPAAESYLDKQAILAAARSTGVEAVHPGYGFLAEDAEFAQACLDAGLVWVGPSPAAMRALGDKAGAKALAEQHDVPVLPGYHGADQAEPVLLEQAQRIGPPLLIKASAGGGGRGMRLVEDLAEFPAALEAARREALAAFGDGRVLLERAVRRPRHVEVQIFGDQHGHLVYLGERECSVQRRNQKLIEETPSPGVDAPLRRDLGEAALRLARAAGYTNAGTVEFLLDPSGEFFFLEVNARLQVEHPVTEAVTGLDLVELQLQVASGAPLGFEQADVRLEGHAIEARVIAEDPLANWAPSSGRIQAVALPDPTLARTDTWIEPATTISPYYDSLLAKVIVHAARRESSLLGLAAALRSMRLEGVRHNLDLLLAVLEHPAFIAGRLHTGFLDEHAILDQLAAPPAAVLAAASAFDALQPAPDANPLRPALDANPWRGRAAWRLGRIQQPSAWLFAGRRHEAQFSHTLLGDGVDVQVGSQQVHVRLLGGARLTIDDQPVQVWAADERFRVVEWQGRSFRLLRAPPPSIDELQTAHRAGAGAGQLVAPMPGRVAKVAVQAGDEVAPNQPLVVIEAMKMEHVVEAPHAGTVTEVCVEPGQQVASGTLLVRLGTQGTQGTQEEQVNVDA